MFTSATLGNTVISNAGNSLLPISHSDSPKLNVQEGNPSKMNASGKNWGSPESYHCNHLASFQQNLWGKFINQSFCLAKHSSKCLI